VFGFVLIPLLAVHLLLVNVAMAGPFVCIWLEWRGTKRDDILADRTGERLARDVVWSLLIAMAIGVLMLVVLWFRQDRAYFSAALAIPRSRLWFGLLELVLSLVLLAGYAFAWKRLSKRRIWHRLLAVIAGANLAYHFPPLFTAIAYLADRSELRTEPISREAFRSLLVDRAVLSMSVHVWLASVAVVGVLLMFYALKLRKKSLPPNELGSQPARIAGWGAWLALVPTVLQLLVGVWVVIELPNSVRDGLLGNRLPLTLLFGVSLLVALRLMHVLASIALGDRTPRQLVSAIATMVLTVLLMTATLHVSSRREELLTEPSFSINLPTQPHGTRNDFAIASIGSKNQPAPEPGL
jgi:hypothetical protein